LLRFDGKRTVRLIITPPPQQTLGALTHQLKQLVATDFSIKLAADKLHVSFKGSADAFAEAMDAMLKVLVSALVVLLLLLAFLFRSVKQGVFILLTMPIALFGGAFALMVMNLFTTISLDILTLFGFVIAAGLVVNNAILIVAQEQTFRQEGKNASDALFESIKVRGRPIYISALTSIFGMLPLMLSPGIGAQMYRGMATVLVGAMTFSLLFGVFVVAALYARQTKGVKQSFHSEEHQEKPFVQSH
jgi:multidrug efflux pump subunit AcrB